MFIREQIAGDLLPAENIRKRAEQMIATGFLAVGPKNLDTQDKDLLRMDVVDEQIDTIGKALLGTTIGCARCHDHKFDPIPTRDYYALAGIFRSTKTLTPGNVSGVIQTVLPATDAVMQQKIAEYEAKVAALEARINKLQTSADPRKKKGSAKAAPFPPVAPSPSPEADAPRKFITKVDAESLPGIVVDDSQANIAGTWIRSTVTRVFVGKGYIHDNNRSKGEMSVSYSPAFPKTGIYEVRFSYSYHPDRAQHVPLIVQHADGETTVEVDERLEPAVDGLFVSLGRFRFNQGNDGSVTVVNNGTKGVVTADAVQFLAVDDAQKAPAVQTVPAPQPAPVPAQLDDAEQAKKLESELNALRKTAPSTDAALAVRDEEQVGDYSIAVRGDVHRLGEPVPRGYLSLASYEPPSINSRQSGRLELAEWMTDRRNPLLARVMANRVWHHLFGAGIVRTTDNFGTTGETPSHPELLDYLAASFAEGGWSVKKLVREIVLSRTYRQSVAENPAAARIDPENRLLWRANRRRLEAEAIRDAILLNSGQLDLSGSPGAIAAKGSPGKLPRTLYLPLQRETIDEMLETFDFADTNLVIGNRNTSNLPTQALFLMNSPFVIEQSRKAAQRLPQTAGVDDRIAQAYEWTLGRPPSDAEMKLSREFLGAAPANEAWAQFYQSLFACVDFRYLK